MAMPDHLERNPNPELKMFEKEEHILSSIVS